MIELPVTRGDTRKIEFNDLRDANGAAVQSLAGFSSVKFSGKRNLEDTDYVFEIDGADMTLSYDAGTDVALLEATLLPSHTESLTYQRLFCDLELRINGAPEDEVYTPGGVFALKLNGDVRHPPSP